MNTVKIFIPNDQEYIKQKINNAIEKAEIFKANMHDFKFYKEMKVEDFDKLEICSKEHATGNILEYSNGKIYILDGVGYMECELN